MMLKRTKGKGTFEVDELQREKQTLLEYIEELNSKYDRLADEVNNITLNLLQFEQQI